MAKTQITGGKLTTVKDRLMKALSRAHSMKEKSEEMFGQALQSGEVAGAAFLTAMLQGRYGGIEVVGIPIDLGAAIGLHVLGFLGMFGKYSEHVHNIADGALACYAVRLGAGIGTRMPGAPSANLDLPGDTTPAARRIGGGAAAHGETAPTDAELAMLAR